VGDAAVKVLLPNELFWDNLPDNHPHKELCSRSNVSYYNRPVDVRKKTAQDNQDLLKNVHKFAEDKDGDFCLVMLGYFQSVAADIGTSKAMWSGYNNFPLSRTPGPMDLGIYIRCSRHYILSSKFIYILFV
jgi:hypothetical protein